MAITLPRASPQRHAKGTTLTMRRSV